MTCQKCGNDNFFETENDKGNTVYECERCGYEFAETETKTQTAAAGATV